MVSCMPERRLSPILLSRSSHPPWAMALPLPCVRSQRLHAFNPPLFHSIAVSPWP